MKPFIQDNERVLSTSNDLLKTGVYAENLVKVIENTPKDKVFSIGVFGGWGTGKSTIIRTAQDLIEKKYKEDIRFITYDAWKYANDSFRRMFLLKVQQELKMRQTEEMSRFYQSETAEAEPKTKISAKGLAFAVAVVALFSVILFLIPSIEIVWKVAFPTIGTLGTFLIALLNGCFYELKVSISKPALFAPEQFEACFKEMMSKCLKQNNWFQRTWTAIKDYVEVGEASVVGLEKLVIVIDNIDRCHSDMAYQMLTDIKTFLSNENYSLVFIVPVDDEALKKHLFRRWNKANDIEVNKEKEEFLRKFFNVTLRIKPHQEFELLHFAHEINKENKLGFTDDTLSIVAKEFADNPRRIIQLLNNLSGDLALYEDDFAEENESAICAALILREEYPLFYKEATKNLNLVRQFNKETEIHLDEKIKDSLLAFMRVAEVPLKKTPLISLQRIFTNTSSIFSDLPIDIQKAVTTYDTNGVIEFAHDNEGIKSNLVDFALEKLTTEVKYSATTQMTKWIDMLSQLFKAGVFDRSRFSTINTALSSHYRAAIPDITNQDALNYMGSQMNEVGYTDLRSAMVDYLKDEKSCEGAGFETYLHGYMSNYSSAQDCDEIAEVVKNFYVDHVIDTEFAYTEVQISHLFGNSFVSKQIESLPAIDDESRMNDIVWCIKNNKALSAETYSALFTRLIELFGNTRGKTKEQYIDFLQSLQPILSAIETSSLVEEPKPLYDLILAVRGIPNPSRPSQPQFDTKKCVLDEFDEEQIAGASDFIFEIVRISGGKIDVSAAISKIFAKNKDAVVDDALKLHSLGVSLRFMAPVLIQADDYSKDSVLTLIQVLLTRQDDNSILLNEEVARAKIQNLIDNSNISGVESLLGKLAKDSMLLAIEAEYVASLDSETINGLPVSIAKHAVSTFNSSNRETFKDNAPFLILVLKQGNASQKKEVVRLMKTKINEEVDLDMVISVLDNLVTEDQSILKPLVGELDGIKDIETVDEETKARVSALASKLSSFIKKPKMIKKFLGKKS